MSNEAQNINGTDRNLVTPDEAWIVDHPDFCYVSDRGYQGYPVVVFERRTYFVPSDEQLAEYRHNEAVVKQHGGVMILSEHQIAGETPLFTSADCAAMRAAVESSLPEWSVRGSWNGENLRTYSVSIERRDESAKRPISDHGNDGQAS